MKGFSVSKDKVKPSKGVFFHQEYFKIEIFRNIRTLKEPLNEERTNYEDRFAQY